MDKRGEQALERLQRAKQWVDDTMPKDGPPDRDVAPIEFGVKGILMAHPQLAPYEELLRMCSWVGYALGAFSMAEEQKLKALEG